MGEIGNRAIQGLEHPPQLLELRVFSAQIFLDFPEKMDYKALIKKEL
jgi:hypothetical protein